MNIIVDYHEIEINHWNQFLQDQHDGNAFQTPEFVKAVSDSKLYAPITVFCLVENSLVGLIIGVIERDFRGLHGFLTSRTIVRGGPIVKGNNKEIFNLIMTEFVKISSQKSIYSHIRNINDRTSLQEDMSRYNFRFEEHLNFLTDCSRSEDDHWSAIQPKTRNLIRRAIKSGLTVEIRTDIVSLQSSYKILEEVYKRARIPLADWHFFLSLLESSNDQFKLINHVAVSNSSIIGCMLTLCYKDCVYDYYAGSYSSEYNKYPNYIIPWAVFRWSKEQSYKIFDFGGAGKPGIEYGVRDYKKKFGGSLVNFGRYIRYNRPFLFKIMYYIFHIRKSILKLISNKSLLPTKS